MSNCGRCNTSLDLFNTAYWKRLRTGEKICYKCLRKIHFNVNLSAEEAKNAQTTCAICGEELVSRTATVPPQQLKNGEMICTNCSVHIVSIRKSNPTLEEAKQFIEEKRKIITEKNKLKEEKAQQAYIAKNTVKEYKRTCNGCGKVWHVNVKDYEKNTATGLQSVVSLLTAMSGDLQTHSQTRRNIDARNARKSDMDKCPECGSGNYSEEIVEFMKKEN